MASMAQPAPVLKTSRCFRLRRAKTAALTMAHVQQREEMVQR
jgi:hypothetical protein